MTQLISIAMATLALMSARFKSEVVITESELTSFVKEVEEVLAEEETVASNNGGDVPLTFLIDKTHTVSADYVPKNLVPLKQNNHFNINRNDLSLRADALVSLNKMADAARAQGITLLVSSTYRSYSYQERLFNRWVAIDGLEEAERESARAGTSQHQLGTAIDFGSITDDFDTTKMGKWMYKNAGTYGWSLSFPKNYEDVTGYRWECWHFRYIGKKAVQLQNKWFAGVQQYMTEFLCAYQKQKGL